MVAAVADCGLLSTPNSIWFSVPRSAAPNPTKIRTWPPILPKSNSFEVREVSCGHKSNG